MFTVYDSQNQPHVLTKPIGSGGEGTVYACANSQTVAKIYHEPISGEKAEKLRWMARNKNESLLQIAAWVIDVLTDAPNGKIVGFLMPNVKAKEIHDLYSLKSRRVHFPRATWRFLIHAATNVARAFYTLHNNAHVMGDVNHGNCVVLADGTIKLIDCDSYSIETDQRRYPCEVGVATHLPPELQGANLREIEREYKHDAFGLAVIIFQLLFLGRHPFAGNYLGKDDKSLEDCIREFRFAYGDNARNRSVAQPPGTLSLSAASPRVANLFERAFLTEQERPMPREWIEALEDLSNNLAQCALHPGHFFYKELAGCPWCEIESNTGLMLFPFIDSSAASGNQGLDIFTVENLIKSFGVSETLPAAPVTNDLPPPSMAAIEAKKHNRRRKAKIAAYHLAAVMFFMITSNVIAAVVYSIGLTLILVYLLIKADKSFRIEVTNDVSIAQLTWNKVEHEWQKSSDFSNLDGEIIRVRKKINEYQTLMQTAARQKIDEVTKRELLLHRYLSSFQITAEIGVKDTNALKIWGLKTAADIGEAKLSMVFQLDPKVKARLLKWRGELEKEFRRTSAGSSDAETRLLKENIDRRRKIENEIEHLIASLRANSSASRNKQRQIALESETAAAKLLQATSDAKTYSVNHLALAIILINLFVLMPVTGVLVNTFDEPKPAAIESNNRAYNDPVTYHYSDAPPPPMPARSQIYDDYAKNLEIPASGITDREIEALSESERVMYANNLMYQANMLISRMSSVDAAKAESKLRLAIRLRDDNKNTFYTLASLLYDQGKYSESLKFFERASAIDPDDDATKIYIGINYLRLNQPLKAKNILTKVVENSETLQAAHFNLGLANEELKDYGAAANNFRRALKLDPNDTDACVELVVSLYKAGDLEGARVEYEWLSNTNKHAAEKLNSRIKF